MLQEFALQGRMHLQYATGDSDQGDFSTGDRPDEVTWGDIEVRRWRLGIKSKWFNVFKLEGQINVSPDWDPFYSNLYDLYLTYAPTEQFNLSAGKTKVKFTKEQEIFLQGNPDHRALPACQPVVPRRIDRCLGERQGRGRLLVL